MTIHAVMVDTINGQEFETEPTDQIEVYLMWNSRSQWYNVSEVTITQNPEYPTPAINITAPSPGIRFTVTDPDGNTLFTNVKPKENEK